MSDVSLIPTDEILKDRADALEDILICGNALKVGVTRYSGGLVQDRIDSNIRQIEVMNAELARREAQEARVGK